MVKDSSAEHGFVCVHNRNRDNYEVALALEEAGLLTSLVTDLYCPDWMPAWMRGPLAKRQRAGLSSSRVSTNLRSAVVQYASMVLKRPMEAAFALSDRMLARCAAKLAHKKRCGLYAYSSYFDGPPHLAPGRPTIAFEYHPHPALALEILASDAERYPQVAWSFTREREVAGTESLLDSWRFADAVVCASSMTRRTLIHAGCPAERITGAPYGSPPPTALIKPRPAGPCQFLFVGQGVQRKGLHHLAEAWRMAALKDAQLTVVSYLIDPGIEAMLDLPGITLLGHQSRAALDAQFAGADVFVMPSLVEGFGLVYLEALAAGCHVIGTTNTGLPDMALSQEAATIVAPGDPGMLADALSAIAMRKKLRTIDPATIRAEGARWSWSDFRHQIGLHAAQVYCQINGS